MRDFARVADAVAATTKKTEKVRLLAEYLRSLPVAHAAEAAIFFSGRAFPAWEERTLQVGGSLLWRALADVSGKSEAALTAAYRRYGDLGQAAEEVLAARKDAAGTGINLRELRESFDALARASGPGQKLPLLKGLLQRASPAEAKYMVKIAGGDLRIGLRESLVEEAIAQAFDEPVTQVQRANMLLGDIGQALHLAAGHRLAEAQMRLFHPIGFMLASPAADAAEAFAYFTEAAVEDKYDGIRAQAHCSEGRVRLFSRTLDEISESFPELPPALAAFPKPAILDGEILAWDTAAARALPFSALQTRLGRKKVSREMLRETPVAYVVFDVLYAGGELLLERPLRERRTALESLFASVPEGGFNVEGPVAIPDAQGTLTFEPAIALKDEAVKDEAAPAGPPRVILAPALRARSGAHLEEIFADARARGNEGLMVKDVESQYTPGRRGKSWLKLKRELATLDVVVTAVEWGHGKRNKVLSDYTFAVRDGERLLNVGKAYSGLTDTEIAEMTGWFQQHTIEDQGFRRTVEPKIVLEVAFNNVMKSDRHESGYALRFPRIVRIRDDKPVAEIDTLERVREIYEGQG